MHPKAALANTTTASDCKTPSGQISRDKPEQGIYGCGGKEFEKKEGFEMRVENAVRNVNKRSMMRA